MRINKLYRSITGECWSFFALTAQILWLCFLGWLISCVVGCTTAHKASKYMVKHPVVGATYCTVYHPCKDSVSEIVKYLEGETIIDTIDNSHTDSFTNTITNTRIVVKYKTITQIKTDTVTSIRTIYQSDKACVELLRNAKALIVEKDKAIKKRNAYVFWLALIILGAVLWQLVKALWFNRVNRG